VSLKTLLQETIEETSLIFFSNYERGLVNSDKTKTRKKWRRSTTIFKTSLHKLNLTVSSDLSYFAKLILCLVLFKIPYLQKAQNFGAELNNVFLIPIFGSCVIAIRAQILGFYITLTS